MYRSVWKNKADCVEGYRMDGTYRGCKPQISHAHMGARLGLPSEECGSTSSSICVPPQGTREVILDDGMLDKPGGSTCLYRGSSTIWSCMSIY